MKTNKTKSLILTGKLAELDKAEFITNQEYDYTVAELRKLRGNHDQIQNKIYDFAAKLTKSMKAGHPGAVFSTPKW